MKKKKKIFWLSFDYEVDGQGVQTCIPFGHSLSAGLSQLLSHFQTHGAQVFELLFLVILFHFAGWIFPYKFIWGSRK